MKEAVTISIKLYRDLISEIENHLDEQEGYTNRLRKKVSRIKEEVKKSDLL